MDFSERLNLYVEGGLITSVDVKDIKKIIVLFDEKYHIQLCEENASFLIAHICAMYHRNQINEEIGDLSDQEIREVKQLKTYPKSIVILEDVVKNMHINVKEVERNYLLLHINAILQQNGDAYGI